MISLDPISHWRLLHAMSQANSNKPANANIFAALIKADTLGLTV